MELTIRDWMILVGAGMVFIVLVDALRRIYRDRQTEIRLNAKARRDTQWDDDEFNLLAELPNGGARIVCREDLSPADNEIDEPIPSTQPIAQSTNPFNDQDPNSEEGRGDSDATHPGEPSVGDSSSLVSFSALDESQGLQAHAPSATVDDGSDLAGQSEQAEAGTPETLDWLDQLVAPQSEPEPRARLPRGIDPHVFVLNVIARNDSGFLGRDILQILLACDLRFGDMDFFHRHEHAAGRGPIQFSVANMMRPGVFDIDRMEQLQTRGLMFFVTLPGPDDMLKAFDYMYETAKAVAKNLEGDVLDETRSAITRQSIEHMRQQIRELERRVVLERSR